MLALAFLLGCFAVAYARVHHLIVGNLDLPASLYVLEFDDQSLDFRIVSNNTAESSHAWITFGVRSPTLCSFYAPAYLYYIWTYVCMHAPLLTS